ncbi:hypothetical protein TNCV_3081831 [Trichonephila clavipes]|nr:hypothetical protein TNCV_3081831 [Trichonephila clavipes]
MSTYGEQMARFGDRETGTSEHGGSKLNWKRGVSKTRCSAKPFTGKPRFRGGRRDMDADICEKDLEVDSDDIQELLDSLNQELTMDELIEMHEQGIEQICLQFQYNQKIE